MSELYENLLKATDNTSDITNEKYGTITKLENNIASVRELDSDLEHSNVPIMNGESLKLGDKVILGFIDNNIYNPQILGTVSRRTNNSYTKDEINQKLDEIINRIVTLDTIYPVGSIYMSINSVNPSLLFGGQWEQLKDTFLLSAGDVYSGGSSGGEATHTITEEEMPSHTHIQDSHNHSQKSHNHTQKAHSHSTKWNDYSFVVSETTGASNKRVSTVSSGSTYVDTASSVAFHHYNGTQSVTASNIANTAENISNTATNQNTGGGQAHNNMPPYLTVYMWKRIN